MGSSKYEFEPEQFEKDINNKIEVAEEFKADIMQLFKMNYRYHDGVPMSRGWKIEKIREVLIELIEGDK